MVRSRRKAPTAVAGLLLASALVLPAQAASRKARDHDDAIVALQRGEILPLPEILTAARKHTRGDVIEVELERDGQTFVYEIRVLTPAGRVERIELNARTGERLEPKARR